MRPQIIFTKDLNSSVFLNKTKKITFGIIPQMTSLTNSVNIIELNSNPVQNIHRAQETTAMSAYKRSLPIYLIGLVRNNVVNKLWRSHGIPIRSMLSIVESNMP